MKCPICGQELRPGKKDPSYLLCYDCKKKFKNPAVKEKKEVKQEKKEVEQKYSNIPPKAVREKRETEMKKAYDEMLAVGDGKKKKKRAKPQPKVEEPDIYDDIENDYDDDEKLSKAPIIILGIAILVVAAAIAYMLLR
ncbi:MAG: hypothetical protein ACI4UH_01590 [Dorea sp.]